MRLTIQQGDRFDAIVFGERDAANGWPGATQALSDPQIQLISGHESKKSLEVYQYLSMPTVEDAYQEAVPNIGL